MSSQRLVGEPPPPPQPDNPPPPPSDGHSDTEEYSFNPDAATNGDLERFVTNVMFMHEDRDLCDFFLWSSFQGEFKNFTINAFRRIRPATLAQLYKHLITRGVYVTEWSARQPRTDLPAALLETKNEAQPRIWSDADLMQLEDEDVISRKLLKAMGNYLPPQNLAAKHHHGVPPPAPINLTGSQPPAQHGINFPLNQGNHTPQREQIKYPSLSQQHNHPHEAPQLPQIPVYGNNYTKEASLVSKLITEEDKYSGAGDCLDFKITVFTNLCHRYGLPYEGYMMAFPALLKGIAKDHFYTRNLGSKSFEEACNTLRETLEGAEFTRKNLAVWDSIYLEDYIKKNPDKSICDCFLMMVNKLLRLRHGIPASMRHEDILSNRIIMACQSVAACSQALADPPAGARIIVAIQTAIATWEKVNAKQVTSTPAVFYTDRKYHNTSQPSQKANFRNKTNRKCYVCSKETCRSWKHTKEEQEAARDKFKARFDAKNGKGDFNSRYRTYMIDCEGANEDDFETLIQDSMDDFIDTQDNSDTEEDNQVFLTSLGPLNKEEAKITTVHLANKACNHLFDYAAVDSNSNMTALELYEEKDPFQYITTPVSRYNNSEFMGVMIDTGASRKSTAGYGQFQAFKQKNPAVDLDVSTKGQVNIQFGIGNATSIGSAVIETPIGTVAFHVIHADTPFLLCLADLDRLKAHYNNIENLVHSPLGATPVIRRFGHPFMLWNSSLTSYFTSSLHLNPCFLSDTEIKQLHRRFGHPSVNRLHKLLQNADKDVDIESIKQLTDFCHQCQKHGKSPGRFRFNLKEQDDVEFNFNILVDVMYIDGKPVLHVVDEATKFQAGQWLDDMTAKHTWDALRTCWMDTYLGPPDQITHDAGTNFSSQEFRSSASTMGVKTKEVPVEAHNSIGLVERYHGPLRRAYKIIQAEISDLSKEACLQMALKAINNTMGPNGLVPTLLVFGAYPRISELNGPSIAAPSVTQRGLAVRKAMEEIRKITAKRQVNSALSMRNGPNTAAIQSLPLNSPVLVWREGHGSQKGQWQGPFNMIALDGETCTLELPHGPTQFRSTAVKPYMIEDQEVPQSPTQPEDTEQDRNEEQSQVNQSPEEENELDELSAEHLVAAGSYAQESIPTFTNSRKAEINGLLEKGVFKLTSSLPAGARLFNSRFVDELKHPGTEKAFEKSRLVVQAYNDQGKELVLTQSPTIQRVSQRIIICIAAIKQDLNLYLRDISQAYVQSTTQLNREFFVRPPAELQESLNLSRSTILQVVKPLYGVPEAGNHWFKTYHKHHTENLKMEQSTYDPCLLTATHHEFGLVGLQTDDTLFLADTAFAAREQKELLSAGFAAKEREQLSTSTPLKFNGGTIKLINNTISLSQATQCRNLSEINSAPTNSTSARGVTRTSLPQKDQYIAQRARGAYIASVCQPEASYDLSSAAQAITPTEQDIKQLNKRLEWQIDNAEQGLKYVPLDADSLKLMVFTDASFANNKDLSSQIGYIIALTDKDNNANILHWSSIKCKRVTRSVLASELYAMAHGYDISVAIKSTLDKILRSNIPLVICTDSKSLYDCLVRLNTTLEKRLMIDVMGLRQAYERKQITEIQWIEGASNPADAMTKSKPCSALKDLIDSNSIKVKPIGWVERQL